MGLGSLLRYNSSLRAFHHVGEGVRTQLGNLVLYTEWKDEPSIYGCELGSVPHLLPTHTQVAMFHLWLQRAD